jgi:uncharacterized OB-fold protein
MEPDWLVEDVLAPSTGGALSPLYDAAAGGVLSMPFCAECAQPLELEQVTCDGCGHAGAAWGSVEPRGTVHAVTTVHRREPGLLRADGPYHVVDVELESGHRLVMTTEQAVSTAPEVGQRMRVGFRHIAGVAVPAALPDDVEWKSAEEGTR